MKKLSVFTMSFFLFFSMTTYSKEADTLYVPVNSKLASTTTNSAEVDSGIEMKHDNLKFGLTINDTYYPIPITVKKLVSDGWSITNKPPYFLKPMVGDGYYETRTNWSLSKNLDGILSGGSIIRLLEKDGVLLEATISNPLADEESEPYQKIEDCVVDSITVFYDAKHTSIKLNNRELRSLTPDILIKEYPGSNAWIHYPNDYRNHPEFGVSTVYTITNHQDQHERSFTIYFDLENTAFKISAETYIKN